MKKWLLPLYCFVHPSIIGKIYIETADLSKWHLPRCSWRRRKTQLEFWWVDCGGCGQQFKQIQQQENNEQVQDLMIHHAPVELGGGPKLQLLSKPDPEVKIYHFSAAYNLVPQITAQEGNMLSLECEVAGLRPIGKISLSKRLVPLSSARCLLVPRWGAIEGRPASIPLNRSENQKDSSASVTTDGKQASSSSSPGFDCSSTNACECFFFN